MSADLLALWHVHGTGLVAKHTTLYFQDGALTAPSPAADAPRASQSCMCTYGGSGIASMPDQTYLQAFCNCITEPWLLGDRLSASTADSCILSVTYNDDGMRSSTL